MPQTPTLRAVVVALGFAIAAAAAGQQTPAPTPTPAVVATPPSEPEEKREQIPFRPIESNVIINLPSVDVSPGGTLMFLVTHRFTEPLQDGNINNFFTLDLGNTWGFGLWYAPIDNLEAGFYRTSDADIYEASLEYAFPRWKGFGASLRLGEDWRTEEGIASPRSSFFAQAILAYSFGKYVRITAVPTYLQRTNLFPVPVNAPLPNDQSCRANPPDFPLPYTCSGFYENVFNVPFGVSVAITHSITLHGEVYPQLSKVNSDGVGWAVSVEKSLLRHRFAFFAGNQRQTTVDQYTGGVPHVYVGPHGRVAKNVYIGFNLYRAWKLK